MSKELIEKICAAAEYWGGPIGDLFKEAADALEAKAAPVGEQAFAREERYIVVKVSDLEAVGQRNAMQDWLRNYGVRTRSCVVVEADWPEYEPVWQMIEARMTGTTPQPSAVPDEPMKPAAVVNDHYSRDGVNDEISAFLPVGTQLYTASQLEDLRSVLAHERACYSELFAEFMAAPSAPKADDQVKVQLLEALGEIAWSNNSQWQADRARAAIAAARKGE